MTRVGGGRGHVEPKGSGLCRKAQLERAGSRGRIVAPTAR
jgi:hypothetical protein